MPSHWKERYTEKQLEKKRLVDRQNQQRLRKESKRSAADLEERLKLSVQGEYATLIRHLLDENARLRSTISHYRSRLGDIMAWSQDCLGHDTPPNETAAPTSHDASVSERRVYKTASAFPLQRPPPISRHSSIFFHATALTKQPASVIPPGVSTEAILESVTAWKLSNNHGFGSQFIVDLFALNSIHSPFCAPDGVEWRVSSAQFYHYLLQALVSDKSFPTREEDEPYQLPPGCLSGLEKQKRTTALYTYESFRKWKPFFTSQHEWAAIYWSIFKYIEKKVTKQPIFVLNPDTTELELSVDMRDLVYNPKNFRVHGGFERKYPDLGRCFAIGNGQIGQDTPYEGPIPQCYSTNSATAIDSSTKSSSHERLNAIQQVDISSMGQTAISVPDNGCVADNGDADMFFNLLVMNSGAMGVDFELASASGQAAFCGSTAGPMGTELACMPNSQLSMSGYPTGETTPILVDFCADAMWGSALFFNYDMSFNTAFIPAQDPRKGGFPGFNPRTVEDDELNIMIQYDETIVLRDGTKIYADVYRPSDGSKFPALLAWTPYGKHVNPWLKWDNMQGCGVPSNVVSKYVGFETPDPGFWCRNGYAVVVVDARGLWNSEGDATFMSDQEARDCYEAIEWAGTQEWSQGNVGMSGVSYLAWSQWRVASLNPPHLKAINPNEGVTDFFREIATHDMGNMAGQHPLFDDYWKSKNADLSKITVPAYIVASWSDHGLHLRGTLEGFKKIQSTQKWLRVHGRRKFQSYYEDQERQRQFFDKFLKGIKSEVDFWPKVDLEIRERFYVGNFRAEDEWPLSRTQYTKLYLDAGGYGMTLEPISKTKEARYNVDQAPSVTETIQFQYMFPQDTELTGHSKLRLWVEARGNDDMDLFAALDKIDRTGDKVPLPWRSLRTDGPLVTGWLRVSHRELDENQSTPYQPVLKHSRQLKLKSDEIVCVDVEILATSILFRRGEKLLLAIGGSDPFVDESSANNHPRVLNNGTHVIYMGGSYDSHLLVPFIPKT
ncbi:hypothetical protein NM208_g1947 [Fusarium decemcellulare]|uniref:Uncharacterized protein n=1 Tax=Fusarium decemcellulare TaxID=57161 RepID=A0ACC1SUC2_9HYPO|nr:hypothetical protein NM208_g1947 [Fusarium decemcellulare]